MYLRDGPRPTWPAKARHLATAAAAGLPVPEGIVLPLDTPPDAAAQTALETLLRVHGALIARAALLGEDESDRSAAGLGLSLGDLRDLPAVLRALEEISTQRHDRWLVDYRGHPDPRDRVIVQQHVPAQWLIAAAKEPDGMVYVEIYDPSHDPLARGTTPRYAGALENWAHPMAETVAAIVEALKPPSSGQHGLDIELVVTDDDVALVQVRPLSRPLSPDAKAFLKEVHDAGQAGDLTGTLVLDAEHNPAPLSVAHAWLMRWLEQQRPQAGEPTVLAGWLYLRTLPRALSGAPQTPTPLPPRAALALLRDELIPRARSELADLRARLSAAADDELDGLRPEALRLFISMIDAYLGTLVPARAGHRTLQARPDDPLCMLDRAEFVDVLPATWDVASPPLMEVGGLPPTPSPRASEPLSEAHAATLLREWDDHLFALGLAPVRALYLEVGRRLGIGDDIFYFTGDELNELLAARMASARSPLLERLDARKARQQRWSQLRPPLRLHEGRPIPPRSTQRLRGLPLGPPFEGPIAQREDLQDLLRRPPSPASIVVLPALSAQAALAVQSLGLRAICCEYGGAMSHAALIGRELHLSALIGCRGCRELPDGTQARIDPQLGRLWIREPQQAQN